MAKPEERLICKKHARKKYYCTVEREWQCLICELERDD